MAITIATIGRLMKNLDMAAYFPPASAADILGLTTTPLRTF
jgi:hypothetical protein